MKWNIYVVHHSHTDLGYTDLQERVLYNQINYIRTAIEEAQEGFVWTCETYYCVEQFLREATPEEKAACFQAIRDGRIGLSATYLNFTDLVDVSVLKNRTAQMVELFKQEDISIKTAMNADVNGISLGSLDAYLDNGIEFLYTNIHCHHGMYPLGQNMKPYYWESHSGKRLLVWNGEHYNLGNALGLLPLKNLNFMTKNYFGERTETDPLHIAKENIDSYLRVLQESDYPYSFVPISVSGVFSDNAPPNLEVLEQIKKLNTLYSGEVTIEMVTLETLYKKILEQIPEDLPCYKGDLTDWWAYGVGSTPYLVKHYREAERLQRLNTYLDPTGAVRDTNLDRDYEDNALIYAEHTWGHSSTITNPFDTMVQNLDIRKNAYASLAHEAANKNFIRILESQGDIFRYYGRSGLIKAINPGGAGVKLVSFYIEVWGFNGVQVVEESTQTPMEAQISSHPRGVLISFFDTFTAKESRTYRFKEIPKNEERINTRVSYIGSERVKDIVNDYDTTSYKLPYSVENDFFKLSYRIGAGITSLYDKKRDQELIPTGEDSFFTPIYEVTEIRTDEYEERRRMGRNIRGVHSKKHLGELKDTQVVDHGPVCTRIELIYELEGAYSCSLVVTLYHGMPKIDFSLKLAKTLSTQIESVFLPLSIHNPGEVYIDKGGVPFRPGIDQIPGSCMEYYLISQGVLFQGDTHSYAIACLDAPMVYMGQLEHHPIQLCDMKSTNNQRPVHSWVMNNCWETNFKMDLSGITEYNYSLYAYPKGDPKESFTQLEEDTLGTVSVVLESV